MSYFGPVSEQLIGETVEGTQGLVTDYQTFMVALKIYRLRILISVLYLEKMAAEQGAPLPNLGLSRFFDGFGLRVFSRVCASIGLLLSA